MIRGWKWIESDLNTDLDFLETVDELQLPVARLKKENTEKNRELLRDALRELDLKVHGK